MKSKISNVKFWVHFGYLWLFDEHFEDQLSGNWFTLGLVIFVNLSYFCNGKGVYLQRNLVDNDFYENSFNDFGKSTYF